MNETYLEIVVLVEIERSFEPAVVTLFPRYVAWC